MRMNDQHESSMASRKPSFEQSTTRPCRSSFGAKAIECRHDVEAAPFLLDGVEYGLQLTLLRQVERHAASMASISLGQRLDVGLAPCR